MSKGHGGHREGAGRKPKADEQELIEKLSPLEPIAFEALKDALEEGKPWAVRLFFNYMYGKPRETKELEVIQQDQPIFNIVLDQD